MTQIRDWDYDILIFNLLFVLRTLIRKKVESFFLDDIIKIGSLKPTLSLFSYPSLLLYSKSWQLTSHRISTSITNITDNRISITNRTKLHKRLTLEMQFC